MRLEESIQNINIEFSLEEALNPVMIEKIYASCNIKPYILWASLQLSR